MKLHGFSNTHTEDEPAWFHTEDAARRFAEACGWTDPEIETIDSEKVETDEILDTADSPWSPTEP